MLKTKFLFWTLGSVWLEMWKSERIENGERIEKFLVFACGVWFKSIEWRIENIICINLLSCP